jgi:hypothetical protein
MGAATAAGVAAAHNHGLLLKNRQDALAIPDPIDSGLKPWTVTGVLPDRERKPIIFEGKVYVAPLTTVGTLLFFRKESFIMKHSCFSLESTVTTVNQCRYDRKV